MVGVGVLKVERWVTIKLIVDFELAGLLASSFFANTVSEHHQERKNEKENAGADSNDNLIFSKQAPDTLLVIVRRQNRWRVIFGVWWNRCEKIFLAGRKLAAPAEFFFGIFTSSTALAVQHEAVLA